MANWARLFKTWLFFAPSPQQRQGKGNACHASAAPVQLKSTPRSSLTEDTRLRAGEAGTIGSAVRMAPQSTEYFMVHPALLEVR